MKIIKIEMENLNSLKGYWSIDFTHPDYETYHNLFVISGDTGAGKTTILDAITLSLYGKTPRQNTVSKSENELMTRHTGFCMARVTYKCKKGLFESEFFQNRAKNSASGSLQKPTCRIKNLDDGTENNEIAVTKLEEETTKIIELNYDQFCRSIMLAQGQFDTFIKGQPRDRAAILSKLNGTEKYKEIGKRICEKAKHYNEIFKNEETKYQSFALLPQEEIDSLIQEKSRKIEENKLKKQELEKIQKELVWFEEFEKCEINFRNAQKEREVYLKNQNEFSEKSKNLSKAENAEKCNALYSALQTVIKNIKNKQNEIISKQNELETVKAEFENASKDLSEKTLLFEKAEKQKNVDSEVWKKVRDFDSKLDPLRENKNSARQKFDSDSSKIKQAEQKLAEYTEKLDFLEKDLLKISGYLEEHKNDKNLEKTIFVLKEKKSTIVKIRRDLFEKQNDIENNSASILKKKDELSQNKKILDSANEELKNLVNREFVSVSRLLRNQLEDGKACPVCGSCEHPSVNCEKNQNDDEKLQKVKVDVASLNKKFDEAQRIVLELENSLNSLKDENQRLSAERKELDSSLNNQISEINNLIKNWNLSLSLQNQNLEENLDNIASELSSLYKNYQLKENQKTEKEDEKNSLLVQKASINIEELRKILEQSEILFQKAQKDFDDLNKMRLELFGEKNPDDEENAAIKNIERLKNDLQEIRLKNDDLKSKKEGIEVTISNNQTDIKAFEEEKNQKQLAFNSSLIKNGFSDVQEFLQSIMTENKILELKNEQEELKTRNVKTQTELDNAKENLEKMNGKKHIQTSKEELLAIKEKIEKSHTLNSERIGEITNKIEYNEEQGKKAAEQKIIYEKAKEQKNLWDELKSFIGVSGGEDFEVFVEALAFKQLLNIANKYVEAITGKYTLVQVENKVDFLVHDIHFPDNKDDRSVSNMSGGEKFIISLSLALGISELASRNVKVESLFLDEGFGTLSGKYLTEAITSLKSLQASGKMLGIITHIDAVINSFDLKIEAEKTLSGVSVIKGPGVKNSI